MRALLLLIILTFQCTAAVFAQKGDTQTATTGRVALEADSLVSPGTPFVVAVRLLDTTIALGGFNLFLEYDHNALAFDSATFGSLTAGEWEYIAVRTGKVSSGDSLPVASFIRIVTIADQHDQANRHPSERSQTGPGEILRLYFYSTDDRDFRGLTLPLRFAWQKCDDNSFSDKTGHVLLVGRSAVEQNGASASVAGARYAGPPPDCIKRRYNAPLPVFDFQNAAVRIAD